MDRYAALDRLLGRGYKEGGPIIDEIYTRIAENNAFSEHKELMLDMAAYLIVRAQVEPK